MKKQRPKFPRTWEEFLKVLRKAGRSWTNDGTGNIRCERGDCPGVAVARFLAGSDGDRVVGVYKLDPSLAIENLEGKEPGPRLRELVGRIIDAADYEVAAFEDPDEKHRRKQIEAATIKRRRARLTREQV